ncbi:E3 ubiquitin-protein ligase MIB2-like isoform X1 [Haliotis rufescens]|uniref:E3 ubiquitin-protein ligase MIB2-like isoform X1 n=1 Tax=Haliotis rufescens TaxID=6454 RepID=UPI00201FAB26|nr:E3 ubiquitin-protein ligase MIB2-like isoform X1 [Haliotis rufescens]XP_046342698.2 E3 ubiquitin-protein ligase MIB2-like isoform X1 [Haliotis rufescens]
MFIGLRVIRGPDWSNSECDGGEGHVGTVATIEGPGAVDVIWDSGQRSTCKAGKGGQHELRVFDSAPVGIRHKGVTCSGCDTKDFFGTKWTCSQCKDANLCFLCYSADKHALSHVFVRHDSPGDKGTEVKKRSGCLKIRSLGLFPGARVVRGEDWKWEQQDGGSGSKGKLTEIPTEHNVTTIRNIARVKWDNGRSNIYRVGHEGKVDVKYTEEGVGPSYYRENMPVLDVSSARRDSVGGTKLEPGCKVCVQVDKDELKQIQATKGGWSAGMSQCIGKVGVIKQIPSEGVASVEFGRSQYRIATQALLKVHDHMLNTVVRVLADRKKVQQLQEGHGEWNSKMEKALGKVGRVVRVDSDGDIVVSFGSSKWIFNPACCVPAPGERVDDVEAGGGETAGLGGLAGPLMQLMAGLLDKQVLEMVAGMAARAAAPGASSGDLFKAILTGDKEAVKAIVKANPQKATELIKELTPLMIAAHEGQVDIVRVLLDSGVDMEVKGKKGVTAIATAIIGGKELVAQLLIERGANIHVTLNDGQTTLHLAVHKNLSRTLKLLIQKGVDVNSVDGSMDTPLHDAIEVKSNDCIEVLLGSRNIDLRLCNKRNFNHLHLACLRGNVFAVEKLLERDRSLVDLLMAGDSFCALHITAANDHVECARLLLDKGKADVNRKGHKGVTPLHTAVSTPNYRVVELLLEKGADVNSTNDTGDTPLHTLFIFSSKKKKEAGEASLSPHDVEKFVKVAELLLKHKAPYNQKNDMGAVPLQLCLSERIKLIIKNFIQKNQGSLNSGPGSASSPQRPKGKADGLNTLSTLTMALPCCRCFNAVSDITFRPCNHKVMCRSCCTKTNKCPMCNVTIQQREAEFDPADLCKVQ